MAIPQRRIKKLRSVCHNQTVPEREDEEDKDEEEMNYATLQRLKKADERTKAMTKEEYVTWSEYPNLALPSIMPTLSPNTHKIAHIWQTVKLHNLIRTVRQSGSRCVRSNIDGHLPASEE